MTTHAGLDLRPIRNGLYDGVRTVHAEVRLGPTHDVAPEALRAHLRAVRDSTGAHVDYRLDLSTLHDTAPYRRAQLAVAFRQWRASWMYSVDLGDLAQLRTLRRWLSTVAGQAQLELTDLTRIDWRGHSIEPNTATRLVDQVAEAERLLAVLGEAGWGLHDVADRTQIRTGVSLCGDETLLASPGRAVVAAPDGTISLQYDTMPDQTGLQFSQPRMRIDGWTQVGDTVTVRAGETSWTADPRSRALLSELAAACAMVRVVSVPATAAFQALLSRLPAAALHAAQSASPLRICTTLEPEM